MDEDNPDLNLIQLEEKSEAEKEIWAHFDDECAGWTFNDWLEMTQTGKIFQKQQRMIFCLYDILVTGSTLNKHGFFPKPKTNVYVPADTDGQPVSSTKPG